MPQPFGISGWLMLVLKNRARNFGIWMLLTRLFGTFFFVTSTYNPSGWSLWHWIQRSWPEQWMLILPVAFVEIVVLVLLARSTLRSLSIAGIALLTGFLGSFVWVLADYGLIDLDSPESLGQIVLYMSGLVLAIGVCWAAAWVRLTGQVTIDDLNGK